MLKLNMRIDLRVYQWLAKQASPHWKLLLLVIMLSIISASSSVVSAVIAKHLVDLAVGQKVQQAIVYALLFASVLLIKIGFNSVVSMKTAQVRENMSYRMQRKFIDHLYQVKWLELNKYHSGDILTRLTSDVGNIVNGWVVILPNVLALGVQLLAAFVTLLYYDRTLAIVAFLLGPLSIIISWFIGRKVKKMQHQIQSAESQYRSYLHEAVQNMLVIKTFGYERGSLQRIGSLQEIKRHWVMMRNRFGVCVNLVLSLGYRMGYFFSFCWGIFKVSSGSASFGTFTAFLQLVGQIQGPFEGLSGSLPQIILTTSSAERLMEFEALQVETKKLNQDPSYLGEAIGLRMDNLSYAYPENNLILDNASFQIKAGEIIALVGLSGEGKTTIIRLLLALLTPKKGKVYLEVNYEEQIPISPDTRPAFSYVPQGNTLFSGTIVDNLMVASPEASGEDLRTALKVACAWEFVQSLPNGIYTVIGERGVGLSEGQAQRLSIARAVLRKSPILLLDEATSALDQETEFTVLKNIRNLQPIRTCIAITHRSSVFEVCDHICRLHGGVIDKEKSSFSND